MDMTIYPWIAAFLRCQRRVSKLSVETITQSGRDASTTRVPGALSLVA